MKRPFAVIGFSFFAALLFASYSNTVINTAVMIITAALFILSICPVKFLKSITYSLCFLSITGAMLIYQFSALPIYNSAVKLDGKEFAVTGRIVDERTVSNGRSYYTLEADSVDGEKLQNKIKIRMSASAALEIEPFSKISTTLYLSTPKDKYGLSSNRSYKSKGVYLFGRPTDDVEVTVSPTKVPYYYAVKFRIAVRDRITEFLPEKSAFLVRAMCLGDSEAIPDDVYTSFKLSGVVHLFVVSGLHISLIMGVIMQALKKLKFSPKKSALITMPFVIFFVMITGMSPSALRAGIMALVYLTAKVFSRKSDALNSLGFAAFLLLAVNPFSAFNISFLLSFFSTLGVILSAEYTQLKRKPKHFEKAASALYTVAVQTVSANLFTLPVSVTVFGYVSLFSVAANLLVSFAATVLLILGIIFIPLSFIGSAIILKPITVLINLICTYITSVTSFLSKFDFCIIRLDSKIYLLALALCLILIGFSVIFFTNRKSLKYTAVICAMLFCIGFTADKISAYDAVTLRVLSVEGGFAAIIESGSATSVIGCGGKGLSDLSVKNSLINPSADVELFMIPRNDTAFSGNAKTLIDELKPENILISSFGNTLDYDIINKSGCTVLDPSAKIITDNAVTVDFCDNEKASALKLHINGCDILVISNRADLRELDAGFTDCDIVLCCKAPKDASILNPSVAIISNTAVTAQKESLRFNEAGISTLTTADNGDITLTFRNQNEFEIETDK